MPSPNPNIEQAHALSEGLSFTCDTQIRQLAQANQLRKLREVRTSGRWIEFDGRVTLNLASNDYLGLSQHPRLIDAAVSATREYGVGAGASRLVSGTHPLHTEVERTFARFKHAEAALLLPTGYSANLAALTSVAGPGDIIVLDKLVHASLIDAARASSAEVRTFPHLNLERAEHLLTRHRTGRRFLVTDSVFSMDGDYADLPSLCDLADRTNAVLIVDEAHGTGVLGKNGAGLASAQGVAERIYTCGSGGIVVSTASKALGSLGGIITAAQPVIDLLINKARPFIYSTAVPPAQAATIRAAIDVICDEPVRRARLSAICVQIRQALANHGWPIQQQIPDLATPIIPLIVGEESAALAFAQHLLTQGIYAPAIRPPTVAPGQSRVRLSLRADLSDEEISRLLSVIGPCRK